MSGGGRRGGGSRGGGGGRGSSSRGRGRGGQSRRGGNNRQRGRGSGNRRGNEDDSMKNNGTSGGDGGGGGSTTSSLRDEDILIAFMPYLKSSHTEAARIHEDYQRTNDQQTFVRDARAFLDRQHGNPPPLHSQQQTLQSQQAKPAPTPTPETPPLSPKQQSENSFVLDQSHTAPDTLVRINDPAAALFGQSSSIGGDDPPAHRPDPPGGILHRQDAPTPPRPKSSNHQHPPNMAPSQQTAQQLPPVSWDLHPQQQRSAPGLPQPDAGAALRMDSVEKSLNALWSAPPESHDPAVVVRTVPTGLTALWGPTDTSSAPPGARPVPPPQRPSPQLGSLQHPFPPATALLQQPQTSLTSPQQQHQQQQQQQQQQHSNSSSPWSIGKTNPASALPPGIALPPVMQSNTPANNKTENGGADWTAAERPLTPPRTPAPKREAPPPKRVWCHFEEQPGRITVNGFSGADSSLVLSLGPREELTALWSLPLDFLQSRNPQAKSIEGALRGITVGLFRRGCTENGTQASIISKSVTGDNNRSYKYWKDPSSNSVCGRVPFFSPRTPGHVVFRLYNEKDPVYTLAMGPSLHVRVAEKDFEGSVRFILSNFKGKKSNPTSLSSLHSLSIVLETPLSRPNESAARATWGCVQEARKVLDACWQEYTKTSAKMAQLEETVEELKNEVESEEAKSHETNSQDADSDQHPENESPDGVSDTVLLLREKTKALMGGRASCERKWRDSQLAFASILKSVVTNPTMPTLLRRDLISKMRIEFELWCPLSEEFAVLGDNGGTEKVIWYEPLQKLPQTITADDFLQFAQSRVKMQLRTLNFEPNTGSLEDVLFPRNRAAPNQRSMDPGAVAVFNTMSAAMGKYYQKLYADEDTVVRLRELIRERTEKAVVECGAFPAGTRVLIFGSSANGFGSPKSDIDMCLQLPDGAKFDEDEGSGAKAMAKLGEYLETAGMEEVDAARLTARIPILMYKCPNPFSTDSDSEDSLIECDLSMQNPLAVLNTSYLRCYAEITPVTRVLAAIIKRWAKARDINNPARHTLSSYGYIIMLLHFLTYHKRTGNGLVSPVAPPGGNPAYRNQKVQQPPPILPNLHWMDPRWPSCPKGTPYMELQSLPRNMISHPFTESKHVNTYFCRPNSPDDKAVLQMLFPGQDLSLAILLASFFRYYAYEFDYKRHVVSLHSTACRGVVEREMKAELDGWRNYSAALTIEDPFETFYDVAHVLRGGYYHRIRREFAVAYTKIADAASGRSSSWNKGDLRSMSGEDLIDWLCEPVTMEREQQPL